MDIKERWELRAFIFGWKFVWDGERAVRAFCFENAKPPAGLVSSSFAALGRCCCCCSCICAGVGRAWPTGRRSWLWTRPATQSSPATLRSRREWRRRRWRWSSLQRFSRRELGGIQGGKPDPALNSYTTYTDSLRTATRDRRTPALMPAERRSPAQQRNPI